MDKHKEGDASSDAQAVLASQHAAIQLLEQYYQAEMISCQDFDYYKDVYVNVNENVLTTYKSEKQLEKQLKELGTDLLREKIRAEKQSIRKAAQVASCTALEHAQEKALRDLADSVDRDAVLTFELSELGRELIEIRMEKETIELAHIKALEPERIDLDHQTCRLRVEMERFDGEIAKESDWKTELISKVHHFQSENTILEKSIQELASELYIVSQEPERMTKQGDIVQNAVSGLTVEIANLQQQFDRMSESFDAQSVKAKDTTQCLKDLYQKLEMHRETSEQRQRDLDHVSIHLREEQNAYVHQLGEKARLELAMKQVVMEDRHERDRLSKLQKLFDNVKRELKKQIGQLDAQKALLPNLKSQIVDATHQLNSLCGENARNETKQLEMKRECDMLARRMVEQESGGNRYQIELETLNMAIAQLEADGVIWSREETKQRKLLALLLEQHTMKSREVSMAIDAQKAVERQLHMRELLIFDMAKQWNEKHAQMKSFSALYDLLKHERNKYVNLIQASSQAIAEMREKIKILQNEVHVLRNESLTKDTALMKERLTHTNANSARDGLRLESDKCQELYRHKQETIEQQMIEIEKLNSILCSAEKELIRLKKSFDIAVEGRNRVHAEWRHWKDELERLYAEECTQKKELRENDIQLTELEKKYRQLRLEMQNIERQNVIFRLKLPQISQLIFRISELQKELEEENQTTAFLCRDLETPTNSERWRALKGFDPTEEALQSKLIHMEERLSRKKEQLLEKDLVLDEVTKLSDALRIEACERRGETLQVAKQVNTFQSKLKDTTRRMMALVSELSMYQATAMKLHQEKKASLEELEMCQRNVTNGNPPTLDAMQQLVRLQQQKWNEQQMREIKAQQKTAALHSENSSTPIHSTAETRPTAYVPDHFPIPKPYGALAPFKPTNLGSTMRHIRPPQRRDIEI